MDVTRPSGGGRVLFPIFIMMEEPVPYVALAMPGLKQCCPNSAAWESPINPAMGMGLLKITSGSVYPAISSLYISSGSMERSRENSLIISSSQSRVSRFSSMVRLAFE